MRKRRRHEATSNWFSRKKITPSWDNVIIELRDMGAEIDAVVFWKKKKQKKSAGAQRGRIIDVRQVVGLLRNTCDANQGKRGVFCGPP